MATGNRNRPIVMAATYSIAILLSSVAIMIYSGMIEIPKAGASTLYKVEPGDTLYAIGPKFEIAWQNIALLNKIQPPYLIYPGQILIIPTGTTNYPISLAPSRIATKIPAYDQVDSYILVSAQKYGITDPMIVKSMIMQESAFHTNAISSDSPCGIPIGWAAYESKSFGLMQVTPACIEPSVRPNLTQDPNSRAWPTSWFNPQYNIDRGVRALSGALSEMKIRFAGCTDNQYIVMALGAYNSGSGSIYGCGSWNSRAGTYINHVLSHYITFAQMANLPYPY